MGRLTPSNSGARVSNPFRAGGEALSLAGVRARWKREVSNPFRAGGEALVERLAVMPPLVKVFQTPSERAVRRCYSQA